LNKTESALAPTLAISAIPSYARRNKSTEVPAGHVEVEGYLKHRYSKKNQFYNEIYFLNKVSLLLVHFHFLHDPGFLP
jgi:hypothetical protein